MKSLVLLAACAGLVSCMHGGIQSHPEPAPDTHVMGNTGEPTDTATVQALQRALAADPELGVYALDVDVKEGLVVLSGVAASEPARARAERMARGMRNVTGVVNDLQVKKG